MNQTKVVEPDARNVSVMHKVLLLGLVLVFFVPVTVNRQDCITAFVDGNHIRKCDPVRVFKAGQVYIHMHFK